MAQKIIIKGKEVEVNQGEPDPPKYDPDTKRLWNLDDVGGWIRSRWGIVGSQLEAVDGIEDLLDRFEVAIKVVQREFSVDFDELLGEWVKSCIEGEPNELLALDGRDKLHKILDAHEDNLSDVGRIVDAWDLYQWTHYTRANIAGGGASQAAWTAAMAVQAALRLKGRTIEPLLEAGYKHSYVAPAKRTTWYADLMKAAERLRKNGTRDKDIVRKLDEQFDKSRSTIYRVLHKHDFFKYDFLR